MRSQKMNNETFKNKPILLCNKCKKETAVYTILVYHIYGHKDILRIWLNKTESKHSWMLILDKIKSREAKDIFFISMDGFSDLEQEAKEIFKSVVVWVI